MRYQGCRLRANREEKKLSLRDVIVELSKRGLDIHDETLRRWETDVAQPRADALAILAEILECDVQDFFEPKGAAA